MADWMATTRQVAGKEFKSFFATPAAYLFLGGFLTTTLFVVFWVETFFARNIADVRPMFQWLPVLLIFLVAALTMRSWSEERRSGTLESLITAPISSLQLVVGKFTGTLQLIALALLLTAPLPISVSFIGDLDWGPVIGGYVATLFLSSAYIAIGLFMSSRTDNPIVALITTALVCGIFYLVGSSTLTNLFGHELGGMLASIGTGTRFESITRGVLDFRDLYYYVSIVGIFLSLNLLSLEGLRWAGNPATQRHRMWRLCIGLTALNFVVANLWLSPIGWIRADITENQQYSLSDATDAQLSKLTEPLTIRGYFSAKTHPLLTPLVPKIEDLLEEYAVAGGDRVTVEFIDPTEDRDAEEEAASLYGIRPVPFQTADRYQSAVVSSYFDLVIAYGDQYSKLGFRDLIEVKARGEGDIDVVLKNPEYAITGAIRKVASAFRADGDALASLETPVTLKAYVSPGSVLPPILEELKHDLESLSAEMSERSSGKFSAEFIDPDANDGAVATELSEQFGFGPQIASLLDPQPFWFYLMLESEGAKLQVPLPETLDSAALERSLESALQRLTPGAMKTVAVVKPAGYGPEVPRYTYLEEMLGENVRIRETQLDTGYVPVEADLLLVLAPSDLNELQQFAIDQFLMKGGSVVMATSPFDVQVSSTISSSAKRSGLSDWLAHHGVDIEQSMVLDPVNAALPVPVERYIGGIALQEYRMLPYPHFPDIRADGLSEESPITSALDQVTMNWASPILVDADLNAGRQVTDLVYSSEASWTSDSTDLLPNYQLYPESGFIESEERGQQLVAVAVEGVFESYFAGQESPLAQALADGEPSSEEESDTATSDVDTEPFVTSVIERSPESARLIVVASNSFASDASIDLASQGVGTMYTKPIDFMQNAIDWSLEDESLLALRGKTQLARTLYPLSQGAQQVWETVNYIAVMLGLLIVWGWRTHTRRADAHRYQQILAEV